MPTLKLEWVRKLPKAQHGNTKDGAGLSLVSSFNGNDVTIFYLDNSKNEKLPESEPPYTQEEYNYGYLTGIRIDAFGNVSKYNLGYTKNYKTNFYIRYFVEGGNNNLISTERRKRKNVLFSIETK
ncbi:MAG TPA: hypothetical protein VLB84_07875 [Bacteroidia bacterium]|nr:hypothetical protein [Bacteroidia bacterium]